MDDLKQKFLSKVEKTENCWIWKSTINSDGYGFFYHGKKVYRAHRFSYEFFNKIEIPKGMCVCHTCDIPLCVNPSHLWLGTKAENNRDKALKGRAPKLLGVKNGSTKLSLQDVEDIRKSIGQDLEHLAKKFNVSVSHIKKILRREYWP